MKIPSVENIKACYKHKGKWDKEYNLCIEHDDRGPIVCTMPYKGLIGCWDENGANIYGFGDRHLYTFDSDFMQPAALTVKNFLFELKKAIEDHDSFVHNDVVRGTIWRCYNEKGKVISCKEKNAILSNNPRDAILGVRQMRKIKPLHRFNEIDVKSAAKMVEKELTPHHKEYEKYVEEEFKKELRPKQYHFSPIFPDRIYSTSGRRRNLTERRKRGKKK